MKITKFGHSCLLIEEEGARILIDPGSWSSSQNSVQNIDAILITHEHPDHTDPQSLKQILGSNPQARVFTNIGVGKVLADHQINFELLTHGQSIVIKGVSIAAYGEKHAEIHPSLPKVDNTGFMIAEKFFDPGDTLNTFPSQPVAILAMPVVAPWMRLAESIEYAKRLHPHTCFPIHDGMLRITGPFHKLPEQILRELGINFIVLEENREYDNF